MGIYGYVLHHAQDSLLLNTASCPKGATRQRLKLSCDGTRLLAEYVAEAEVQGVMDALEALAGEPLLRMVHTRPGVWLAAVVLAYGTPKDRKKTVKAFKGAAVSWLIDICSCVPLSSRVDLMTHEMSACAFDIAHKCPVTCRKCSHGICSSTFAWSPKRPMACIVLHSLLC